MKFVKQQRNAIKLELVPKAFGKQVPQSKRITKMFRIYLLSGLWHHIIHTGWYTVSKIYIHEVWDLLWKMRKSIKRITN